jgi:enoyl-CoA hydratase/carnithine racemase
VLNAMNADAIKQLGETFASIRDDASIDAAVLTGYGKKAFVSGADIGYLSGLDSPEAAESMCLAFQGAIAVIEDSNKPVVCAMNGIAFGGGCEIAMGCHARIANAGARILAAQPEVNLGIIPGAGGTQRLPRICGFEAASELLRTARPVSSERALELGLVDRLSTGDLIDDAVAMAREIVDGTVSPDPIARGPVDVPATLPDIDLGHLSTAVDEILMRAVTEGGRMTLADGLKHEAMLFAEVCQTEDSKIGIQNFIEKGARSKAEFKNR